MTDRHQIKPYTLRIPEELRAQLEKAAAESNRTLHSEVLVRLESTFAPLKLPVPDNSLYVLLDSQGYPISWHEIHEYLSAIQRDGGVDIHQMRVEVITPELESSSRRALETAALAKMLRTAGKSAVLGDKATADTVEIVGRRPVLRRSRPKPKE